MGWMPKDNEQITLNGAIFLHSIVLKFVAASAVEAELRALFTNAKECCIMWLTLKELGHPQPPTPMHCDNARAAGIANGPCKEAKVMCIRDAILLHLWPSKEWCDQCLMAPRLGKHGRLPAQVPRRMASPKYLPCVYAQRQLPKTTATGCEA